MGEAAAWGAAGGLVGGAGGALLGKAMPYLGQFAGRALNTVRSYASTVATRAAATARQVAVQAVQLTKKLGTTTLARLFPSSNGLSRGAQIVQSAAQKVANQGSVGLRAQMSPRSVSAIDRRPGMGPMFYGTQVHLQTRDLLQNLYGSRFRYFTKGPDFLDTLTGERIELTTQAAVPEHMRRVGYQGVSYVTYRIP